MKAFYKFFIVLFIVYSVIHITNGNHETALFTMLFAILNAILLKD